MQARYRKETSGIVGAFTIFIRIISAAFNCMYNLYRPNEATLGHSSGFLGQTWRKVILERLVGSLKLNVILLMA